MVKHRTSTQHEHSATQAIIIKLKARETKANMTT